MVAVKQHHHNGVDEETDTQTQARGLILDPVSKSMLQARLLVKTNAGFVAVWLVENKIIILMNPYLVTRDAVVL